LASCRFQIVLALEIATPLRPTSGVVGNCRLIREMSLANPLWGAPWIHGELLKLGIEIGQSSVAKYMARRRVSVAGLGRCHAPDGPRQPESSRQVQHKSRWVDRFLRSAQIAGQG